MTTTTTSGYISVNLDQEHKKNIVARLFKDGHITMDELLILMAAEKEHQYIPYTPPTTTPGWGFGSAPIVTYTDDSSTATACCGDPQNCKIPGSTCGLTNT